MEVLKINFSETVRAYDNVSAHNEVKAMMNRFENINVKFYTGKDGYPCAWLDSKTRAGFKLILNAKELNWLMGYLMKGETNDSETNPNQVEAYKEEEKKDIQLGIFKQLVEHGKNIQFTPRFRETTGYVSALAVFKKGKITFRMKETEELNEYLAEKELI